jgi:hypothetical protein
VSGPCQSRRHARGEATAANFFSRDIGRIWRAAEALEYGILGVNEGIISIEVFPTSIELVKVSLRRTRLLGAKNASAVF